MLRAIVATAIFAALTIPAYAGVDTVQFDRPACVDPYSLSAANELTAHNLPMKIEGCITVKAGTKVVTVNKWGIYEQVVLEIGGRQVQAFMPEHSFMTENEKLRQFYREVHDTAAIRKRQAAEDAERFRYLNRNAPTDPMCGDKCW